MRKKIFLIGIAVLLLLSSFSTYIFADDVEEKTIEFLINEEEIKEESVRILTVSLICRNEHRYSKWFI